MLIQRSRLSPINQVRFVLSDPMRQFMPNYVHGNCEAIEKVVVTVSENHFSSVPERVVVLVFVVDGTVQREAQTV